VEVGGRWSGSGNNGGGWWLWWRSQVHISQPLLETVALEPLTKGTNGGGYACILLATVVAVVAGLVQLVKQFRGQVRLLAGLAVQVSFLTLLAPQFNEAVVVVQVVVVVLVRLVREAVGQELQLLVMPEHP
jgi:hypothetical protein